MLRSGWMRWACLLGVALGGFFDGILLHQILQWHHLLSLVPGAGDLRMQVLWDGYFHALMYGLAAFALWGLWRSRAALSGSGRGLAGALMVGFGLWHVLDSVLSHWVLGIHRVNLRSSDPLLWDLIWFGAFGLVPLAIGLLLIRSPAGTRAGGGSAAAVLALAGLTSAAGAWAARPPSDQTLTTVVFAPGRSPAAVISALSAADARLAWADPAMSVVVVHVAEARRWRLIAHGAVLISGGGLPGGCVVWSGVDPVAVG